MESTIWRGARDRAGLMAFLDRRPGPLLRLALRAPTLLYRVHLGWLLGNRFLCIVHRGRRTGKARRTVVEVVGFDRGVPEATVIAGWGAETQWYRNLEATPALEVSFGRRRWRRPDQYLLDEPARAALLDSYANEHPTAAREVGRALGIGELDERGIAQLASCTRAVAFRPSDLD